MFTYEDRRIAVDLYYKQHGNGAAVIRELGYPSRNALRQWVKDFKRDGDLHKRHKRKSKFSKEECEFAVKHYLEHRKSIIKTIRAIGYPSRYTLFQWLKEDIEGYISRPFAKSSKEEYTDSEKKEAVIDLMVRDNLQKKCG